MDRILSILFGGPKTVESLKRSIPTFLFLTGSILFWEVTMHLVLFQSVNPRIGFIILFSVFFGFLFTFITGIFRRKGNIAVLWIILSLLYVWYCAQLIYYKIFGGFISVYLIQMGGDAITNFFKETLNCFLNNLWLIILLALPLAVAGVLLKLKKLAIGHRRRGCLLRQAVACVLLHLICLACLGIGGTGAYSIYDIYHNVNTGTDTSVANLGFLTTFRLELKWLLFGDTQAEPPLDDLIVPDPTDLDDILGIGQPTQPSAPPPTGIPDPSGPSSPSDPTVPTEPVVVIKDQVLQIDFDALIKQATDAGNNTLLSLHQYFSSQTPTKTNDFTGMFEGYNLIYLVCESFSPEVISKEMTPTLYKLYNEGIRFNNFYGTYRNVTTNGEYTACLGIFPDLSRNKTNGSFKASAKNHLPFALGNAFQDQLGVKSFAYHNFKGDYYDREKSHPNMGYSCKFMHAGMEFSHSWPSSDFEMMQQSVGDYVNEDQFHAYYMTFSGHYQYNFQTNPMCIINQDAVAHLDNSEAVRAYIACHLELEKAMAYLMQELEAAGKLENTVIVMTSDHYPYGLEEHQYNELAGEKKDTDFGIYENAFICWAYGMEDPIEIDTPCCTVDILPTLLNLFGLEYDSRLLIGRDVLDPSALHVAILYNGSFITDKVKFNSKTGEVIYLVDKNTVSELYVDTVNKIVQGRFTASKAILDNDYYRIVLPPNE